MPTKTVTTPLLRVLVTNDIRECLDCLHDIYPTLSDAELVKLTIGAYSRQLKRATKNPIKIKNNFYNITQNFKKSRLESGLGLNHYQSIDTSAENIEANSY